jgi:hypothetical protein
MFGGYEKTTLDLLWFRFFGNSRQENSRRLFFNGNRASGDYWMNLKWPLAPFSCGGHWKRTPSIP